MQIFSSRGDAYDYPNIDFTGDNVSGIYIWGAPLERGTTATPYIRTTTIAPITTYFSSSQNPVYTFTSAGNYSVSLTAMNAVGSDSSFGWVNVSPVPVLAVTPSPASVIAGTPTPVTFTVKNQTSGLLVNGATVTLTGVSCTGTGVTGPDGNATIGVNASTPGTITATASLAGYTNGITTVTATTPVPVLGVTPSPASVIAGTPTPVTFTVKNQTSRSAH